MVIAHKKQFLQYLVIAINISRTLTHSPNIFRVRIPVSFSVVLFVTPTKITISLFDRFRWLVLSTHRNNIFIAIFNRFMRKLGETIRSIRLAFYRWFSGVTNDVIVRPKVNTSNAKWLDRFESENHNFPLFIGLK